ncbi:hypothetical protein [Afipia clevelandensis]|uniref:hypothetical protein n=1 Tax=Afipia clevelandensis TaxID=1034 RepID=UPI0002F55326|nr:hypothetical protein [Afipia clevelandensis]
MRNEQRRAIALLAGASGVMMRRLVSAARNYSQGLQRAIVMEGDAVRSSEKRAVSNWKAAFRIV